jgi:DNA polymerase-3 subunit delta
VAASFKPAYLIHGDDHGRIAERRARLRAIAEAQAGVQGVEVFDGERSTPEAVATALNALTFAFGRRFLIVDGVERWKERELGPLLAALAEPPPETTVSFFAREDGRFKAPKPLHAAVSKAGGDIATEGAVKPWELPGWVVARARELGLALSGDAARALIAASGERQQRLLRELETLELALRGSAGSAEAVIEVDVETVTEQAAASSERRVWALADELLSDDPARAARTFLTLRNQGERVGGMLFSLGGRLRDAHRLAAAVERGIAPAEAKAGLRMPPKAQDQLLTQARRIGAERLRSAVAQIAELDAASHGGGTGGAEADTRVLRLISAFSRVAN